MKRWEKLQSAQGRQLVVSQKRKQRTLPITKGGGQPYIKTREITLSALILILNLRTLSQQGQYKKRSRNPNLTKSHKRIEISVTEGRAVIIWLVSLRCDLTLWVKVHVVESYMTNGKRLSAQVIKLRLWLYFAENHVSISYIRRVINARLCIYTGIYLYSSKHWCNVRSLGTIQLQKYGC